MASQNVLLYFIPVIVIFVVAVSILHVVYCRRKCLSERATEAEVGQDPNNFERPANIPEWVTSLRLLLHHYYMQSNLSLVRETACQYFPSVPCLEDTPQEIELGVV